MIHCAYCKKRTDGEYHTPDGVPFCSTDCAIMAGRCSITKGWINEGIPPLTGSPKRPWYMPEEEYDKWVQEVTKDEL